MEIRQLRTFVAVAERLHFTRAAEDLHLAQSSVSAQIQSLEEELQVRLFDRLGRSVMLTDAGDKLFHYAKRMLDMSEEIRAELADEDKAAGTLVVRTPETLAREYMPEVVERFSALHPLAELRFINCDDSRLSRELNSGRIDLAFLLMDTVIQENVSVRMIKPEPLALVAAPSHPLAGKEVLDAADMQGRTVLHLRVD